MNWKLVIKIAVSGLAIYWVSRQVDVRALGHWLATVPLLYTLAAFVLYNISKIASAYRLNLFFKADHIGLTESENLLLYYKGMFYNLFLPGGIGGDGYKIVHITRAFQITWHTAFKAVLWDRISGAVALLFLSLVLLLFVPALHAHSFLVSVVAVSALITFPVFYLVTIWMWPVYRASAWYSNTLALGIQLLQGVTALVLLLGLGVEAHQLTEYLVVFFVSSLATIAPITIGGIGVRELVFVLAARYTTIDPDQAVAFSVMFFFVNALSSLIGAFVTVNLKDKAVASQQF